MPPRLYGTGKQNVYAGKPGVGSVVLAVEELEALRLCDLEGLDQDEAAQRMNVSRGTLQRPLYDARIKQPRPYARAKPF